MINFASSRLTRTDRIKVKNYIKFNFSHVKPAAMLGYIIDFQALYVPLRFSWWKRFVKGYGFIGIQVIHDQNN